MDLDSKNIEATNFENSSDLKSLNIKNQMPELGEQAQNGENCQKSANLNEGEQRTLELKKGKTSKDGTLKGVAKPRKNGTSIRKSKVKPQTSQPEARSKGTIKAFMQGGSKQAAETVPEEAEKQPSLNQSPVKQEFIVAPFRAEDVQMEKSDEKLESAPE